MRIKLSELRRIIKEEVEGAMGSRSRPWMTRPGIIVWKKNNAPDKYAFQYHPDKDLFFGDSPVPMSEFTRLGTLNQLDKELSDQDLSAMWAQFEGPSRGKLGT